MKTIGIVTVLYNSQDVLNDFFISLSNSNNINIILYIIENNLQNPSYTIAKKLAKNHNIKTNIIINNNNLGVAKGNNQGIQAAIHDGCKYILLANNDITFNNDTINQLVKELDAGESVSVPKIYFHSDPNKIWYGGGTFNILKGTTKQFVSDQSELPDKYQIYQEYSPTCFVLFKSDVFLINGLMDEIFFVYYDDTDFMWRLKLNNIKIKYVPSSKVWHKVSSLTGGNESNFSLYWGNRNRIIFIRKNLKNLNYICAMSYTLLTRLMITIYFPPRKSKLIWSGIIDGLIKKI